MKNKITLALLLSSSALYAADYLIIVDKTHNKYNVIETPLWIEASSTYTNWIDTGEITNCNIWSPSVNQQKNNFSQNTTCDFEQERIESVRNENTVDGTFKVINTIVEKQLLNKSNTRNVIVASIDPIIEKNNYNCETWSPLSNEVYTGTTFEQERYCDVDMMQKWTYKVENSNIDNWEERYVEQTGYETQNIVGTLALSTCNDILENGHSRGDDTYRISFNGGMDVRCDMTRNGGGWTQITDYNFSENPDNIPPNLIKTVNRTITAYHGGQHTFTNGWYPSDTVPLDSNGFNWTEIIAPTNGMSWTQTMVDLHNSFEISIDGFNVINASRDSETVNGQYLDGASLTYGNNGSRTHLFSSSSRDLNVSRLTWLNITDSNLFNNYGQTPNMTGSNAFVSGIKPSGSENISVRLMANQPIPDEIVGLQQFTVWIK